jgi:hypothetical protein
MDFSAVNLDKDEHLVNFVGERWDTREQRRERQYQRWTTNIAMYLGHHYHAFNRETRQLFLPKAPHWRVRYVANRVQGVVRKIVSKALRKQPHWTTIPATQELEDAITSRLSTKVLAQVWREHDMDWELVRFFTWMGVTGSAFMRCFWDANAGDPLIFEPQDLSGIPVAAEEDGVDRASAGSGFLESLGLSKKESKELQQAFTGDVAIETVSPFEMDPDDASAEQWKDVRYTIHTKARTTGFMRDQYGKDAKGIMADSTSGDMTSKLFEGRLRNIGGPLGDTSKQDDEPKVIVHQLWANPTKQKPRGFFAVVANNKIIRKGDNPYTFSNIPYEMAVEIPVPGRLWGTSALEQAIPIQMSYNRGRSIQLENRNAMARPKWKVPRGAGIIQGALNDRPGEVIEYNFPFEPKMEKPPEMPEYTRQLIDLDIRDLEDVTNIHEVSNARVPAGVRSGIAITQLQEQDDTMLGPTFMVASRALSRIGSYTLQMFAQNVTTDRLLKIVGKDFEFESQIFQGKDLVGNSKESGANYFDVELQMGSQLPLSKDARKQLVIDLTQAGIFNPIADRDRILEILNIGSEEAAIDAKRADMSQARRENLILLEGTSLEVNPWDDDAVHIDVLRLFQKQPDFRRHLEGLPHPERVKILFEFEEHAKKHAVRLAAMQQSLQSPPGVGPQPAPAPPEEAGIEGPPGLPNAALGADPINDLAEFVAQQQGEF